MDSPLKELCMNVQKLDVSAPAFKPSVRPPPGLPFPAAAAPTPAPARGAGRPNENNGATGTKFKCTQCQRDFNGLHGLQQHQQSKHSAPQAQGAVRPVAAGTPSPAGAPTSKTPRAAQAQPPKESHTKASQDRKPKNTESFEPDYTPPHMRLVVGNSGPKFSRPYSTHDVVLVPELYCTPDDNTMFEQLLAELKATGKEKDGLWTEWHGDSHVIANDRKNWKHLCPVFNEVLRKMSEYFHMDIQATRLNWYRDSSDWKPFHHDRAAFTPNCPQNMTVAASFGLEREIGFLHAKTGTSVNLPVPNGSAYAFGRDVNVDWRHGVVPIPPKDRRSNDMGRISIIAWGWVEQPDAIGERLLKKGR